MTHPTPFNRRTVLQAGAAAAFAPYVLTSRAAVELRLTHPADLSHPVHLEAEKMAKRIADRTSGSVKITLFPNNALGSPVETAQQTRLGAIDMILMNPANIEAISKSVGVINIPYQFDNYEHAHRTLDVTARDWISQQLATAGFTWIANFEWGFRALSNSRRPMTKGCRATRASSASSGSASANQTTSIRRRTSSRTARRSASSARAA